MKQNQLILCFLTIVKVKSYSEFQQMKFEIKLALEILLSSKIR
jgi:hypothetical protein